jgi:AsmA family protein
VRGEGRTLNEAARTGHASAVVEMRGGSISRRMLEIASTDIRSVFRWAEGMSPIACLVGVLDMRGGAGTVSPLRVRAREGTITGSGRFDLFRRQVDLTISSETPSSFALDIPVRVSGAFADPSIRPAQWSAEGRAQLAASDNVNALLPALRPFARRNPCLSSH